MDIIVIGAGAISGAAGSLIGMAAGWFLRGKPAPAEPVDLCVKRHLKTISDLRLSGQRMAIKIRQLTDDRNGLSAVAMKRLEEIGRLTDQLALAGKPDQKRDALGRWLPKAKAKADDDGWIEWAGGECPVDAGFPIEVKFRDEAVWKSRHPRTLRWDHWQAPADIIAYRVVPVSRKVTMETVQSVGGGL